MGLERPSQWKSIGTGAKRVNILFRIAERLSNNGRFGSDIGTRFDFWDVRIRLLEPLKLLDGLVFEKLSASTGTKVTIFGALLLFDRPMDDNYQENWQRYKRVRNLFWVLFLGLFPALLMIVVALGTSFESPALVIAAAWFVLFLFVGNRVSRWRCPRCSKIFAGAWWYNKGFAARRCEHCGLPKYGGVDPGPGTESHLA